MTGLLIRLLGVGVTLAMLAAAPPAQTDPPQRFTVQSDGHPIAVWARVPAEPRASVLLVHGRTWSSLPDFDLQVPGLERSVMRSLAKRGVAAYALDLRGYGETPRDPSGWLRPTRAAADVASVMAWLRGRHPQLAAPALVGWSRGGAIATLAAQAAPAGVSALVMFGFIFEPDADFSELPDFEGPPARAKNTAEAAAGDFISPRVTSPAVIRAFVQQALRADPVLVDLNGDKEFAALDVKKITIPTLVLFGDRDPSVTREGAERMVGAIAADRKRLVVLPGADHAAQLESTHGLWIDAVANFVLGMDK